MDSGVSIFNLSTRRNALSLLRYITGPTFGEAWRLETGDCKTREILHFPPFLLRSLTEETGCKRSELVLCEGPCILNESGELLPISVLR